MLWLCPWNPLGDSCPPDSLAPSKNLWPLWPPTLAAWSRHYLRFRVGSSLHCKLLEFVNVFTYFARPSTQRHAQF